MHNDRKSRRMRRAHGDDLLPGQTQMRSNFERMDTGRGGRSKPGKGAEPTADPMVRGSKLAHMGMAGAPDVYTESYQGRMGMKGKRRGTM